MLDLQAGSKQMSRKKRPEPPILALLEEEVARVRKKVTPLRPYDPETNAIHLPPATANELRVLVANGRKVEAVRRVAELTGAGLRVSRDYDDDLVKPR